MLKTCLTAAALSMIVGVSVSGQGTTVAPSDVSAFLGTWVIHMTEPKGALETLRITDSGGRVSATVQAQQFQPIAVADMAKIGKSLVMSATRFENGKPLQAIVIVTVEMDTMHMIQELEGSTITKRGSGKRQ